MRPRFGTARDPARRSRGATVARLAHSLGMPLMPWQRHVADVALEVDSDGRYVHPLVVVIAQRQSGKTQLLLPVAVHRALTIDWAGVYHTAQSGFDARDRWLSWAERLESIPFMYRQMTGPAKRGAGREAIRFRNHGQVRPFAPQPAALHGRSTDLVAIDEAWAFAPERGRELEVAIVPTQATRPGAQVWIVSAAGSATSTWLRSYVDRGRDGDPTLCYFEYSIPDEVDPLDVEAVCRWHPAVGHTITPAAVRAAAGVLSAADFARSYGCRWTIGVERVIPADVWAAAVTDRRLELGRPALGVDVSADRSHAAIAGCVGRTVELIDHRPGVSWVIPRLRQLVADHRPVNVVIDRVGAPGSLADGWDRIRPAPQPLAAFTARDYANACASLLDGLRDRTVLIRRHPALDAAADAAASRPVGDAGFGWARRTSMGDISPLVAATLALWGAGHAPVAMPRPQLIAG